jgi:hypothetical protein
MTIPEAETQDTLEDQTMPTEMTHVPGNFPQPMNPPTPTNLVNPGNQPIVAPTNIAPAQTVEAMPNLVPSFSGYIYASGTVTPRFPNMGLEKEYIQALASISSTENLAGYTDRYKYYKVFTYKHDHKYLYRYIARQMCWVLSINNIDAYILLPNSDDELEHLIHMLDKPVTTPAVDVDVAIGVRGAIAPANMCNGLQLPLVTVYTTYTFPLKTFVDNLPHPQNISSEESKGPTFQSIATQTFYQVMQLADNVGNMDEQRAINYLVLNYPNMYTMVAEQAMRQMTLQGVKAQQGPLSASSGRTIIDIIFTFHNAKTNATKQFYTEVDVSGMYPFLVQGLQSYYGN